MTGRDANQLAADMEETLRRISAWIPPTSRDAVTGLFEDARAALDALVARITDLEAQLADAADHLGDLVAFGEATARARAAEAQVTALTRGYDSATLELEAERHARITDNEHLLARAEAAEAEVERLTEALRGIASQEPDQDDVQDADPEFVLTHPRVFSGAQVARAVLAGRKDTQQ